MIRPRLKPFPRHVAGGEISLFREAGVRVTLSDPDGEVLDLLDSLDGTRTVEEVGAALAARRPGVSLGEVAEAVAALDEAGLLEDAAATTALSERQRERYASNLAFFGTFATLGTSRYALQEALGRARVVLLGVGGVGSTLLLNLAGLGVGHVTALDCDTVELKNLSRQFLYSEAEVGQPKLERALARARALNPELGLEAVERRITGPGDVAPLLPGADLVLSVVDQPAGVQSWVNAACVAAGVPFIAGGIQVARAMYYSIAPGRSGCLACWDLVQARRAEEQGWPTVADGPARINRAIGPAASLVGALIALEAVRYLTGFAPPVSAGQLWLVDLATGQTDVGDQWPRLPECAVCGAAPGGRGAPRDGQGAVAAVAPLGASR